MAFLGYVLLFIVLPIFIFARVKENMLVLKVAKFINIGLGVVTFMNIFIDESKF